MRLLRAMLSAAILAGAARSAAAPFELVRHESPGGARLLLAPRAGRRATLVVQFARGSVDDGNVSGLTRLAQHVLLEANARLDWPATIARLHAGGGTLRLETALRSSAFVLEADRREFDVLAPALIVALLGPAVDRDRFPVALQRALHDGKAPGSGTGLLELIAQVASSDTRYHNEPWGDPDQMELVEPKAVEELLGGPFAPANATIVAAGSFDMDRLVASARRRGGRPVAFGPPPFTLPVDSRGRAERETHVLAWPFEITWPQDAAALRVLASVAEQILWKRFREGGVAYSFQVSTACSPGLSLFVVTLPVRDRAGPYVSGELASAMEDVRMGRFEDVLLERARAIALGALVAEDEDSEALATAIAAGGALWHDGAVRDRIQSLDRQRLGAFARQLLARERSIALYFGPDAQRMGR